MTQEILEQLAPDIANAGFTATQVNNQIDSVPDPAPEPEPPEPTQQQLIDCWNLIKNAWNGSGFEIDLRSLSNSTGLTVQKTKSVLDQITALFMYRRSETSGE